tara:strand:+ start:454 stop:789 length:336 start_codon:yes stop_codon:yes gene_type:complete
MGPIKFYTNSFSNGDEESLFGPWSFIHLGSGIIAGGVAAFYLKENPSSIDTLAAIWLGLVLLWEVFELVGVHSNADGWAFSYEHPLNRLTDISLGLLGFALLLFVSKVDIV